MAIAATWRLIADRGIEGTTMREIAREMGHNTKRQGGVDHDTHAAGWHVHHPYHALEDPHRRGELG